MTGAIGSSALTFFALGIFAGAAGKSAQVPLHVWLPDAMEGPTPVSALIHAATMVAAGVYLVARMFPVFTTSATTPWPSSAPSVASRRSAPPLVGLVMTDIKRVLAYSTISQLGYMMLALGCGGYVAAIFHLFTHAFFKALLFLGSGSVNHATNTFDMRKMGGLRKHNADDVRHLRDRQPQPGRHHSLRRLLEQGRDPERRLAQREVPLRHRPDHRRPHRLLHVPRHLHDLRRRVQGRRAEPTSTAPTTTHEHARGRTSRRR